MKVCKVEGCGRKHKAIGYCERHYFQIKKHGKILERTIYDPNEIIIKGDHAEVVLYNKKCREKGRAIIDIEDVVTIQEYKWGLNSNGYVETYINDKCYRIQHIIMGVKASQKRQTDHKDRNKLNNRKSNLRICTSAENAMNRGPAKKNTSGFKGVSWNNREKVWRSAIVINGKQKSLGSFKDKVEAATTYNIGAIKYHKEFAFLNEV